jgi:hypothetical protein
VVSAPKVGLWRRFERDPNGYLVDMTSDVKFPMPGLLIDGGGAASDHDPATSHEHAPIEDRPVRDPSYAAVDDPVTEYGRQLWTELYEVAHYLRESTASLRTEAEWAEWRVLYARVLSVLAGPAGDQGFGEQEAQVAFQNGYRAPAQ